MHKLRLAWVPLGRFIRDYSQVLSGLTIGICSIIAATIISGGVGRLLEGNEEIVVTVQGFNSPNSTDRLLLAHNFGSRPGTVMAEVVIVANDARGNELDRLPSMLNAGVAGGSTTSPFTLPSEEGRRYFLVRPNSFPDEATSCTLEFQVMQRDRNPREGKTPPFDCSRIR